MGVMKKGSGYTSGGGSSERTAIPRSSSNTERPWGTETPKGKSLTMARFTGVHIIQTESPTDPAPRQALIDAWLAWRDTRAHERYKVLDMVFEHYVTAGGEEGFLLYITYSEA